MIIFLKLFSKICPILEQIDITGFVLTGVIFRHFKRLKHIFLLDCTLINDFVAFKELSPSVQSIYLRYIDIYPETLKRMLSDNPSIKTVLFGSEAWLFGIDSKQFKDENLRGQLEKLLSSLDLHYDFDFRLKYFWDL